MSPDDRYTATVWIAIDRRVNMSGEAGPSVYVGGVAGGPRAPRPRRRRRMFVVDRGTVVVMVDPDRGMKSRVTK